MKVRLPVGEQSAEDVKTSENKSVQEVTPRRVRSKLIPQKETRDSHESDVLAPLLQYHPERKNKGPWKREALSYLRAFIAEGRTTEEIKKLLNIDDRIYDELEAMLMEADGARFIHTSTAQRFYVYSLRMEHLSRQLDVFVRMHMKEDPRKSGVVGAIKAQAQMLKDMMLMGQELGIINKRAKEVRVLGEINLAALPSVELQELFEERMKWFEKVVTPNPELPASYNNILQKALGKAASDSSDVVDEDDEVIDVEFEERRATTS